MPIYEKKPGYDGGPLSITGIQDVMERNVRRIASMQPGGAAEIAVREAVILLHRYAVQITHVGRYKKSKSGTYVWAKPPEAARGGGSLKSSHRMDVNGLEGKVYIDPGSVNPLTKQKPAIYGIYENARGGQHAFYDRTVDEIGDQVSARAQAMIKDAVIYAK
jgi:hypothetical protein